MFLLLSSTYFKVHLNFKIQPLNTVKNEDELFSHIFPSLHFLALISSYCFIP